MCVLCGAGALARVRSHYHFLDERRNHMSIISRVD